MLGNLLVQQVDIAAAMRHNHVARLPVLAQIFLGIVKRGCQNRVYAALFKIGHQHGAVQIARILLAAAADADIGARL